MVYEYMGILTIKASLPNLQNKVVADLTANLADHLVACTLK